MVITTDDITGDLQCAAAGGPSGPGGGGRDKKHRLKQRFQVIRKLGQGTYGKVQLAVNKDTGQEVSV